jgi:hypothetical protein
MVYNLEDSDLKDAEKEKPHLKQTYYVIATNTSLALKKIDDLSHIAFLWLVDT